MKSFVLPSLQPAAKKAVGGSQVSLPSLPSADLTATPSSLAFPFIVKGRRLQELRRMEAKAAALELAVKKQQLERLESEVRGAICGREHEKRYQLLWHYQKAKSDVERRMAVTEAKALALQRSQYMRGVRDYKERGQLLHLETVARAQLVIEETDARSHAVSLLELKLLEERRRQAALEVDTAARLSEDVKGIRDWESRIAVMSFRLAEAFSPTTQLRSPRNVGTGGYRGRTDLLMDYTVCEEERRLRWRLILEERVLREPLEWQHGAAQLQFVEEAQARAAIEAACLFGACQARLSAVVRIQRWWRMLCVTAWSERKRRQLKESVTQIRSRMTSRDYLALLGRLERQAGATVALVSLEELQKAMTAIERAAEMAYQNTFDYFIYTLMNRAANLQETEAHDLCDYPLMKDDGMAIIRPVSRLLSVPYRLYVRQQPQLPYPQWRALRWVEGSAMFIQQVRLLEKAEAEARARLWAQKDKEFDTLQLYSALLKQGAWTWRSLYTEILCIGEEENMCRGLLHVFEDNCRGVLKAEAEVSVSNCIAAEGGRWRLLNDESQLRHELVAEERDAFFHLTEDEWRWNNLVRLRTKLQHSCGGRPRWGIAPNHDMDRKYLSLDTTARIIQRFFRFTFACKSLTGEREAKRAIRLEEEMQLKTTAAAMVKLLEAQHRQEDEEKLQWAATKCPVGSADDGAGSCFETAVSLFCDWFDERTQEPMELQYKAIVARFMQANRETCRHMRILFAVARDGRQRIEEEETVAWGALHHTSVFAVIAIDALERQEVVQRERLERVAAEARSQWPGRVAFLAGLVRHTTTAVAATRNHKNTMLRLLRSGHVERLVSREEVVRMRLIVEERRERGDALLSLRTTLCVNTLREEQQEWSALCDHIDKCWSAHAPLGLLVKAEAVARRGLESWAYRAYDAMLTRMCAIYAQQLLFQQFLCGHLIFESEARHFDRRLTELLSQRVGSLDTKLDELVAAETCARARVEYFEATHRSVYFCPDDVA
ncbi:hypothetical protein TraAM80_08418 [Trypanosoma rangeli]|uniref:Uncharacterized protein n=1 Tax=Trypanosoma rangeli TaxID=5698 RepID=A0A3R7M441_TRYRA|nr:uncharacterized protein TraAM80_08418 [Trypanosoma rangeli]RNE99029.1 hypothetical protein TraAM80_08418 [Trypanosoma rangeli]|eukprot:RNE99029.1 hypothetical protein TraAM80_08418 [Trypanosoma rangeli]